VLTRSFEDLWISPGEEMVEGPLDLLYAISGAVLIGEKAMSSV
jgi:hypothetical protein